MTGTRQSKLFGVMVIIVKVISIIVVELLKGGVIIARRICQKTNYY